jgi:hypothetical protein
MGKMDGRTRECKDGGSRHVAKIIFARLWWANRRIDAGIQQHH